ncbi:nuclear protein MDM1-like isoform X2 [Gigantopelta aegis]|uniref:nuclear protein MDM1-like isoform X2 n=1 Tax=Gigantopelta aegis TaxID=1735272 RepID=UPI001B88AC05|nr:nuclear protein MDM1-like isoform X2 [Gigantopelta aegis]
MVDVESFKIAKTCEPSFQHKKRVDGPPVSYSLDFYCSGAGEDEYALLGQQDKFAPNVQYRPRRSATNFKNLQQREASPPKQQKLEKRCHTKENKHKPAPVVDTLKFTELDKPKKSSKKTKKASNVSVQKNSEDSEQLVTPLAPRKPKNMQAPELKAALKDKNLSDVLGEKLAKTKDNNMNAFVQTDMAKGVAQSAQEAPAEYAMKYKAGIVPPRPGKKMTEYQREFEWKNGIKSSPLLAAQDMLYKDQVGPGNVASLPKTTEYTAQFKPWMSISVDAPKSQPVSGDQQKRKTKVKRSKSVGAQLSHAVADDKQYNSEPDQESQPVPNPLPHHGKLRKVTTEYRSNFKSPLKCTYSKGAWKGADPPQLFPQKNENVTDSNNNQDRKVSSWFTEVLELREKAAEYKKRAQGTHFSREHLVQLLAKQTNCWDDPPTHRTSSTLSALSLDSGPGSIEQRMKKKGKLKNTKVVEDFDSCKATMADSVTELDDESSVRRISSWEERAGKKEKLTETKQVDNVDSDKFSVADSVSQGEPDEVCLDENTAGEGSAADILERENDDDASTITPDEYLGRLPTPQLRSVNKPFKKVRHHLARTTPAVGGAILTSPPPQKAVSAWSADSDDSEECRKVGRAYQLRKLNPSPTCGMPSRDTHCLRDDFAMSDRPLRTHYVHSPVKDLSEESGSEEETRHSRKKVRDKPHFIPGTIKEQMGETYNRPNFLDQAAEKDDDVLSISVRSVASSCSLASDVYERSKQRRDNFWSKGVATK